MKSIKVFKIRGSFSKIAYFVCNDIKEAIDMWEDYVKRNNFIDSDIHNINSFNNCFINEASIS